jgi:mannose-6-phosphate isomerase-like protein (cupin superfamily)
MCNYVNVWEAQAIRPGSRNPHIRRQVSGLRAPKQYCLLEPISAADRRRAYGNAMKLIHSEREPSMTTPKSASYAQSVGEEESGEWLQTRPGERCRIRVSAAETNGAYSVVEIVSSPGDSTPMHVHQNEDEYFLIVEGTARIACGDQVIDATAGMTITLPRNIPHAWGNPTNSPLRLLGTCTPGGVEDTLRLIAQGGDIDIMALAEAFGVRVVGPPLLQGYSPE